MSLTIVKQPPSLVLSGDPVIFYVQTTSVAPNTRITGALYGLSSTAESFIPDANNQVVFNFSDYLKGLPLIGVTTLGNTAVKWSNGCIAISFVFLELVDNVLQGEPLEVILNVMEGAIPNQFKNWFYNNYQSFKNYLIGTPPSTFRPPFLSLNTNRNFTVFKSTPLRFYWGNLQESEEGGYPSEARLALVLWFSDGDYYQTEVDVISSVVFGDIVEIPIGYDQLGLQNMIDANKPGKILDYYIVEFIADPPVTDFAIFSVFIDKRFYQNPRTLFFRNNLNAFEHFILTGLSIQENEYKTLNVAPDPSSGRPDKITWKVNANETIKANTGFITSSDMHRLAMLLESKEVYELINGVLTPIVLHDTKIETVHDDDFIFSADLSWDYAYGNYIESE